MSRLIGVINVTKGGHVPARVGAYAPASGAGGRMPGSLRVPGGDNSDRRNMPQGAGRADRTGRFGGSRPARAITAPP